MKLILITSFEYFRSPQILFKNCTWWNKTTQKVVKKLSLSQKCESLRGIFTKTKCKLYVAFVNHTYAWGHYSQQHSIHIPPMRLPRGSGPAPASMVHWSPRVQLVTTQTTHTSKQLLVFTKFPLLRFFCNDIGSQIIIWNNSRSGRASGGNGHGVKRSW